MITPRDGAQSVNGGYMYPEKFFGLSTDTKPSGVANGSEFFEIDSGKSYTFDYAGGDWYEGVPDPGVGGGGGSGSDSMFVVTVTTEVVDEVLTATADKTLEETIAAYEAGSHVLIHLVDYGTKYEVFPEYDGDYFAWLVSYVSSASGDHGAINLYSYEWYMEGDAEVINIELFTFYADDNS